MVENLSRLNCLTQIRVDNHEKIEYILYSHHSNKILVAVDTKILIYNPVTYEKESEIDAHSRVINSLTELKNGNIISAFYFGKKGEFMKKIGKFFGEVKKELSKVKWPTKKDMVKYSIATIVFVIFFACFFYGVSLLFALVKTLV